MMKRTPRFTGHALVTVALLLAVGCGDDGCGDDQPGLPIDTVGGAGGFAGSSTTSGGAGGGTGGTSTTLDDGFADPPREARPTVYWWWLDGCVTEDAITRDLEAMAEQGMGGVLITDAATQWQPQGSVDRPDQRVDKILFDSPRWHELFIWAVREAARVGLDVSINIGSGWNAGGPWISAQNAQKRFVSRRITITGPQSYDADLPLPQPVLDGTFVIPRGNQLCTVEDYADVAIHAVRADHTFTGEPSFGVHLIDLTPHLGASGRLVFDFPVGPWTITRFGMVTFSCPTYPRNPGADDGRVCDTLSEAAVDAHFAGGVVPLIADLEDAGLGSLVGTTFTHVHDESWDRGTPTWTADLPAQFEARRGYSMLPYLAYLGGTNMLAPAVGDRFWYDYGKTVGELFRDNFYGRMLQLAHDRGIGWQTEGGNEWAVSTRDPGSPWGCDGIDSGDPLPGYDLLGIAARGDRTMGEFWSAGIDLTLNKQAATAAHLYGKTIVQTEAFTGHLGGRNHYMSHPALLKPFADRAFIDGANRFVIHNYTMSPEEYGAPGIQFNWLINLNRQTTWWSQAHAFFGYLARSSYLLQQGLFVADVCAYRGDSVMVGSKTTVESDYDVLNTETLLTRASVDGHRIALPDGMSYAMLELESLSMPLAALQKIHDLVEQGAVLRVGGVRPTHTPGLASYPAADAQLQLLADEIWNAGSPSGGSLGLGTVYRDVAADEALRLEGVAPDFSSSASPPWNYIHRTTDDADIYLVAGDGAGEATFRANDRAPEIFDPVAGTIRDALSYDVESDGRVTVPLVLGATGSQFVVFRKPATNHRLAAVTEPISYDGLPPIEPVTRTTTAMTARIWRWGSYRLLTASGEEVEVDVPSLPPQRELTGPWQVAFQAARGAPASATFNTLVPWNEHLDSGIRYFSGAATYRRVFVLSADEAAGAVHLDLGELAHLAEVRVNGQSLGVLWKSPWRVDISPAALTGDNDLEIIVTNLWPNRIIGDLATATAIADTNVRSYDGTEPLLPSGLFGPVRLTFGQDMAIDFENLPEAVQFPAPHPGRNVAAASQGANAVASSEHASSRYPASGAIDGNRTISDWGDDGGWNDNTPDVWNDWIRIQFGAVETIDRIDVFTHGYELAPTPTTLCGAYGIADFEVQYHDGAGWVAVSGGATSGNTLVWRQFTFPPVTTDRIRVVVSSGTRFSRIVEVEAWAP